jgi:hypothetical protein
MVPNLFAERISGIFLEEIAQWVALSHCRGWRTCHGRRRQGETIEWRKMPVFFEVPNVRGVPRQIRILRFR